MDGWHKRCIGHDREVFVDKRVVHVTGFRGIPDVEGREEREEEGESDSIQRFVDWWGTGGNYQCGGSEGGRGGGGKRGSTCDRRR